MRVCSLCNSSENDEQKYGELLSAQNITVHYFCLLFSPSLMTRGTEDEGIRGFLIEDIERELKRVKRLICCYCLKQNASLGCCVRSCRRAYHLPCGLEQNVSLEFVETYPSYCYSHAKFVQEEKPKRKDTCGICMERISRLNKSILIPCCKNSWFHRTCLQKFATTAGDYFKCPLCNDKTQCLAELPRLGIFIPSKDADWELEDNAFDELINPPEKTCDSANCWMEEIKYSACPWMWKICSTCGSGATHEICHISESREGAEFTCKACTVILDNLNNQKLPPINSPSSSSANEPMNHDTCRDSDLKILPEKPCESSNCLMEYATYQAHPNLWKKCAKCSSFAIHEFCHFSAAEFTCKSCAASVSPESPQKCSPKKAEGLQKGSPRKTLKNPNFVPWFSDDEQISDVEDLKSTNDNRVKKKTRKRSLEATEEYQPLNIKKFKGKRSKGFL